jgi:hypothetical protein
MVATAFGLPRCIGVPRLMDVLTIVAARIDSAPFVSPLAVVKPACCDDWPFWRSALF